MVWCEPAGTAGGGYHVAYPVEAVGALHGVVVLDVSARAESELQAVLRQLHWGAAGLELLFYRGAIAKEAAARERLQSVLELVATAAGQERYTAAAMSLVTELATRLQCDRVSIGFLQAGKIKVDAVSHSAQFKERTNLMRAVSAAMDEAVDQGAAVSWPPVPGSLPVVARSHEALAKEQGGAVATIPLQVGNAYVGAITLERRADKPFDDTTLDLVRGARRTGRSDARSASPGGPVVRQTRLDLVEGEAARAVRPAPCGAEVRRRSRRC